MKGVLVTRFSISIWALESFFRNAEALPTV